MQESLCMMWGISESVLSRFMPWMRASSLRSRLQSQLHYIYTTDWLVKIEGGITSLQNKDIEKVGIIILCVSTRCVNAYDTS